MLILTLLCCLLAFAQEPSPTPVTPVAATEAQEFAAALERAKQLYFEGQHSAALEALRELQVQLLEGSVEPAWEDAAETMIFVGEVNLELDRLDPARTAFRWVLERDPDYEVSPYHHPPHVRAEFFQVQAEVKAELASRPVAPPVAEERAPLPLWGYLPLGIPQFAQRRPVAGVGHLTLQAALGAGSFLAYRRLQAVNPGTGVVETDHPLGWTPAETRTRVQQTRFLVQWPLTVGFYGAWAASILDARHAWRQRPPPGPANATGAPVGLRRGRAATSTAPGIARPEVAVHVVVLRGEL